MEAEVIKANGERFSITPKNGTDFSLQELKEIVGGWIEVVWLPNGKIMVVNEEGKRIGLAWNETATLIYAQSRCTDIIVGDVLYCDEKMVK